IFPSALTGSVRYSRENLVDWSIVAWTAPCGLGAAVGGSLLSHVIPGHGHVLMVLTAALIAFTAARMGRARDTTVDEAAHARMAAGPGAAEASVPEGDLGGSPETAHRRALIAVTGGLAGALSGLLGVGGGVILVPAYVELLRVPIKTAIATSLVCVGLFAVPSTFSHAVLRDIAWTFSAFLPVGGVPA